MDCFVAPRSGTSRNDKRILNSQVGRVRDPPYCLSAVAVALGAGEAAEAPALVFGDDEAGTTRRAAATGMQAPFGEGEAVVVGEFFARGEVAAGDDPDVAADDF